MYKYNSENKTLTVNIKELYDKGIHTLVLEELDFNGGVSSTEETNKENTKRDCSDLDSNFYDLFNKLVEMSNIKNTNNKTQEQEVKHANNNNKNKEDYVTLDDILRGIINGYNKEKDKVVNTRDNYNSFLKGFFIN